MKRMNSIKATATLLTLATATLLSPVMVSCSSNGVIEDVRDEELPIGFSAYSKKATRANAVSSNNDLAEKGGFYVWGWKSPSPLDQYGRPVTDGDAQVDWTAEKAYQVFGQVNVYDSQYWNAQHKGATITWTYKDTKYWDKQTTYCFYAVGPVGMLEPGDNSSAQVEGTIRLIDAPASTNVNEKVYQISNVPSLPSTSPRCNDFVISDKVIRDGRNNNGPVDFTFHHIMSKVVVKLATDIPNATLTVTDLRMTGWDNRRYTYTQNTNGTNDELDQWAPVTTDPTPGEAILLNATTEAVLPDANGKKEKELPVCWLMVPQKVEHLTFDVKYKITYSDGVTDEFSKVGVLDNQNWKINCLTTYTLTVSPQPIQFSVSSVNWTKQESEDIIINGNGQE